MPNWVDNTVTISGSPEEVAQIKAHLSRPYERKFIEYTKDGAKTTLQTVNEEFSLWNIVQPKGDELIAYNDSIGASGTFPYWYGWNIQRWGTKWDVDIEDVQEWEDESSIIYYFRSAWDAPHAGLSALAQQFPNLIIHNEFEEEQGWGGEYVYKSHGYDIIKEWDIPASHASHDERGRECICEWSSDPETWFSDCPNKAEVSA